MADSPFWQSAGINYGFACGVHPHNSKDWDQKTEDAIVEATSHERCVAWGECGLDYHYNHSPRDVQVNFRGNFVEISWENSVNIRKFGLDINSFRTRIQFFFKLKSLNFRLKN
jgi:Tat protein secretion system quality control protein TatD with DNase activity